VPVVYDGYYGGYVPVEDASFDVSLTPDAVIHMPLHVLEHQCVAAEAEERRRLAADARRARPRCDGSDHRVATGGRSAAPRRGGGPSARLVAEVGRAQGGG
jgi:hypothetical protein